MVVVEDVSLDLYLGWIISIFRIGYSSIKRKLYFKNKKKTEYI